MLVGIDRRICQADIFHRTGAQMRPRLTFQVARCRQPFDRFLLVINEDSVLEEEMDNLREAAQRIRATQNLMRARGMTEEVTYRDSLRASLPRLLSRRRPMWRPREGAAFSPKHTSLCVLQ